VPEPRAVRVDEHQLEEIGVVGAETLHHLWHGED
jgi:hypothetical protein